NSTLPSLIHITERLIEAAQNRLEGMPEEKKQQKIFQSALGFGGTTVEAHYEKEISEAKEQLEKMEKTFMALIDQLQEAHMKTPPDELEYDYSAYYQLEQTKNVIFIEMQTLTEQINDRMQRLLTLQSDNTPAYLSYKPISGQWGLSAAVMLIPGTVMGIVGSYPSPQQRLQPAMSRESFEAVNDLLKQHSSLHLPPVHSSKHLLDAAKEAKEQKLTTEMTTKLWDDIYSLGAVRLTQQFHSLMISATSIDGQKLFVVCDPKGRNFDLYDHKSIGSLLKTQA
ncbi:MAG: hypothetical protein KDK65_06895, partial [Chlamydiia bacterium]|nr:hypothetical protein [Chlamydiia bacterium]